MLGFKANSRADHALFQPLLVHLRKILLEVAQYVACANAWLCCASIAHRFRFDLQVGDQGFRLVLMNWRYPHTAICCLSSLVLVDLLCRTHPTCKFQ